MCDQISEQNHDLQGGGALFGRQQEVLSANLDCGARVVIEAEGPDEQKALDEIEALLLRFRDEEGGSSEASS